MKKIRTELVSAEDLKNAKAKYIGNFVMQIEKPATIARYALNIATLGLTEDFYENYVKNINAVTAEDIKNTANKYFLADNTRVVVVGKAADVLPGLEALSKKEKMPIFYFDKYGNKAEKPVVKKEIPSGVTAQSVLKKHLDLIGGEKALNQIKTMLITYKGTIQGQELVMVTKSSNKNMNSTVITGMGMTFVKNIVGKDFAYTEYQGKRTEVKGDEYLQMKKESIPFQELAMLQDKNVVLTGIEKINEKEAYVLVYGKSKYYYDVTTGYRIAVEMPGEGGKPSSVVAYNDYKEFKGIKYPYLMSINAGFPLEFSAFEVKINEGVTDKDFE